MVVENTGVISLPQLSVVLYKFSKETFKDIPIEQIIELMNKKRINTKAEPPISGFSDLQHSRIGQRDEILVEYLVETPFQRKSVRISEDGELTWSSEMHYVPKLLEAHIRPYSGIIECFTSDKRFLNLLLADIRDSVKPIRDLEVEKVAFSEECLEQILSKNEELLRVKFDQLDHTYLKEIILKGDLIDASEEYKYYRTQKNGKLCDFHIKFYTKSGSQLSLIVNRYGSLRFFRTSSELTWEIIEEYIDELIPYLG